MLKNVIVYLVGFPGTGKLTVARELALLLNARVVDNHWINNPILGLIDSDRVTPFPEDVWDQIAKVRKPCSTQSLH
jgi:predicted kinase